MTRNERTIADNKAFSKMTKARKRVTIARDVLAQLAIGKLTAEEGVYVCPTDMNYKAPTDQLQALLAPPSVKCTVCGIGALFVTAVQRADKLTAEDAGVSGKDDGICGGTAFSYLRQFFEQSQLALIEAVFEGWGTTHSPTRRFYDSVEGGDTPENAQIRLRLIMENIVAHKGTFCPGIGPQKVIKYVTPGFKG